MNAFTVSAPRDDRLSRVDATCQFRLPWLRCDKCESDWRALGRVPPINPSPWIESDIWYPSFTLAKGADPKKFSDEFTVTLPELNEMRKLIVGAGVERAKLLPGSQIGPVRAKLPKRPTDFVWSSFSLMASKRVIDIFGSAGIHVPHGRVVVTGTGAKTDYVALQLDPVALYSKETLTEMTLVFCSACGHCWMQNVRAKCSGPRQFVRRRVPEGQGLVRALEGLETLASESFIEVVRSKKLSGIEFEQFGVYV